MLICETNIFKEQYSICKFILSGYGHLLKNLKPNFYFFFHNCSLKDNEFVYALFDLAVFYR